MEAGLVIGLSITTILVFGLLMERFRLPMVLGVLLAGALIGPSSPLKGVVLGPFNLDALVITQSDLVAFFGLLGSVLILFGIGLEFSFLKLRSLGLSTFLAALIKLGVIFIIGSTIVGWMGFSGPAAILLGLILSFSSTPIVIKILEGQGKLRRPETNFIMAVLIIEDLMAVAVLGIMSTSGLTDQYAMALALLKVLVTFVFAYFVLSYALKRLLALVEHSDELMVLFVVSALLVISYLCQAIGLGFSVGAFLAGSIVAASAQARRIEEIVKPFNALFASFFFFSIGMLVDLHATLGSLPLLIGLVLVATIGKYFGSAIGAYLSGLSGRSASFASTALLPLGELSLLIASNAAASGLLPLGVVGLLATIIILTSILSIVLVGREAGVYNYIKGLVPEMLGRNLRMARSTSVGMQRVVEENSRYQRIVSKLPAIGHGHPWAYSSHDALSRAVRNAVAFGGLTLVFFLLMRLAAGPLHDSLQSAWAIVFLGFYLTGALFLVSVAASLDAYTHMLTNTGREGLRTLIHVGAVLVFGGLGAASAAAVVLFSDGHYLIFWVPMALLGGPHLLAVGRSARMAFLRLRVRI